MKPSDDQLRLLEAISDKNVELKSYRAKAWMRHEQIIRDEMAVLRVELSQICNRALASGVSKTRIGRAMGTANWETISDTLSLAAPELEPGEASAAKGKGWAYDDATLVLTLHEWKNRRTNAMEKKRVDVQLEMRNGELWEVDVWVQLYERGGDLSWFSRVLTEVNRTMGYGKQIPATPDDPSDPPGYDQDEMFRQAALRANNDDEDDD